MGRFDERLPALHRNATSPEDTEVTAKPSSLTPTIDSQPVPLNDRTTHVICCDPNTALCGLNVSEEPEVPEGTGHDCIVCLDLEEQPCPHCGAQPAAEA
jgi:hypothetical protein